MQTNFRKTQLSLRQSGFLRADLIGLLIGAALLGSLLLYGSISGQELPLWPSLLVIGVNVVSAINVFLGVKKRRQSALTDNHSKPGKVL